MYLILFFFFQAEDGIRDYKVTGVQTCALPISLSMKAMQLFLPYSSMRKGLLNWDRKMLRLIRPMGRLPSTTGRLIRSRWRVKTSSTFSLVSSAGMHGTGGHRSAGLGGRERGPEILREARA